jgi:putative transcriptional regulator
MRNAAGISKDAARQRSGGNHRTDGREAIDVNYHATGQQSQEMADALLAAYAAGSLSRPLHVLVASHLVMSTRNRRFVSHLEDLQGAEIESGEGSAPIARRDQRLAAIFDAPAAAPLVRPPSVLPAPLADYVGRDLETLPWRRVMPGVREYQIEKDQRLEASLLWITAGRRMPAHTHEGLEATLVIRGAFSDLTGRYVAGDIAIADAEVDHKPVTDGAEDCLCFAVTEGDLRMTGPLLGFLSRFFKQ